MQWPTLIRHSSNTKQSPQSYHLIRGTQPAIIIAIHSEQMGQAASYYAQNRNTRILQVVVAAVEFALGEDVIACCDYCDDCLLCYVILGMEKLEEIMVDRLS